LRFDPSQTVLGGLSTAQLQAALTSAQQSYLALMTGQEMVVSVGYDGKTVTYLQTDVVKLESLIALLQRMLGINHGRRALRPIFR
jgi:gpW